MNDESKPSKFRPRPVKVKDRSKGKKPVPVGPKHKPDTPLYVACPNCNNPDVTAVYDDGGHPGCFCTHGFVQTGYTEERYQKLIKQTDKLLVGLDDALRELSPSIRLSVLLAHGYKEADVEAARSRL